MSEIQRRLFAGVPFMAIIAVAKEGINPILYKKFQGILFIIAPLFRLVAECLIGVSIRQYSCIRFIFFVFGFSTTLFGYFILFR